jgi:hypothetical protein
MLSKAVFLIVVPALYAQSIEGVVINSVTRAPVPGASVRIMGDAMGNTVTDASGIFRFNSLKPGQYVPMVVAPGLSPSPASIKAIRVTDGPVKVSLELIPLAKVQGRVRFPDGRPAARTQVLLLSRRGGHSTRTDEEGRFTISASAGPGRHALLVNVPPDAEAVEGEGWAPTYYPNVLERAQATPVILSPGEVGGFEIRLRSVPVFPIRGVVRDEGGSTAAGVSIRAFSNDANLAAEAQATSDADGVFEFRAMRAGDWRLVASHKRDDVELKGIERVTVARREVEGVQIRLARPFELKGFVEREEPRDQAGKRKVSGVSLMPADGRPDLGVLDFHVQDGNIVLKNVYPGRYEIHPLGYLPGFYLASVKLGDREVIGQQVELSESSPAFRVTYEANAPRVRGQVDKGEGSTVVLISQDEAFMNGQFLRTAVIGADGRFEIGSLRPGEYYALAFDRVDTDALHDPAFVRGLSAGAVKVHVENGETPMIELKVTRWPE